ncbi:uncharacterized protein LOC131956830 [Physella acuta]|uniref:uncharacterized protein LOC131956830 n=1 Tax=Physella acuta TaxID=109671 RepID=UPI0027DE783C|nr:uncharacterized protein LOC131956830 [Physella acuta]
MNSSDGERVKDWTPNSTNVAVENRGSASTPGWVVPTPKDHTTNLTFLPILALIIFLICTLLKVYKWCRDDARHKARGDVEFGDDSEVNYGIISAGDKEYIDVRSDGISVYDTVSSFRGLGNGYAYSYNSPQYYHETVTSIKSLVLQRADGSQYDSVKSYKAFLEKITQDKDLAVEVKLLENYPIRSKSVEHCVVLEEESSEKSEDVSSRMLTSLPLKKHIHVEGHKYQYDKKKQRHRRASGDAPNGMRKRSASNPTYRRSNGAAASLPSMRYIVSSDSDDDELQLDRKKLWAERKKISRSVSGGKISKTPKDPPDGISTAGAENGAGHSCVHKRKRHYSADSARRHKKGLKAGSDLSEKVHFNCQSNGKTRKHRKRDESQLDESSSENPISSHSSSDSNVPSDGVSSDSDDETKQNTLLSNASDDKTVDNDVFFSLDSGAELASSYEVLQSSPHRPLSDTKKSIAKAKEDFFRKSSNSPLPLLPPTLKISGPSDNDSSILLDDQTTNVHINGAEFPALSNHSSQQQSLNQCSYLGSQADSSSKSSLSTDSHMPGENQLNISVDSSAEGESHDQTSPKRVQRFHVTFVNNDLSSLQSE